MFRSDILYIEDILTQINWKIQISKNKIQINLNIQMPNKQFKILIFNIGVNDFLPKKTRILEIRY